MVVENFILLRDCTPVEAGNGLTTILAVMGSFGMYHKIQLRKSFYELNVGY